MCVCFNISKQLGKRSGGTQFVLTLCCLGSYHASRLSVHLCTESTRFFLNSKFLQKNKQFNNNLPKIWEILSLVSCLVLLHFSVAL